MEDCNGEVFTLLFSLRNLFCSGRILVSGLSGYFVFVGKGSCMILKKRSIMVSLNIESHVKAMSGWA